jgi:hypothetical protein
VLGDNNKEKEVIALPDVHANEFKSSWYNFPRRQRSKFWQESRIFSFD